MKIGFSLSRCLSDIVLGYVPLEDVLLIIARTNMPDEETLTRGIGEYARMGYFESTEGDRPRVYDPLEAARILFKNGRLFQPRTLGLGSPFVPSDEYVWMDLFPTNVHDAHHAEQVQKAWGAYRMALKLTLPGNLPDGDDASQVMAHGVVM